MTSSSGSRPGSSGFRSERGRPGSSPSRSTPSSWGTGGRRGRPGSAAVLSRARGERGIRLVTLPEALERHEPEVRPPAGVDLGRRRRTCAPGTPRRSATWRGRRRRLELRLVNAIGGRRAHERGGVSAPRASSSRSRRATGRSSTAAGRRGSTRFSARRATRGRCWRPYTPGRRVRSLHAKPGTRPEPGAAPRAVTAPRTSNPLLGVPAADRGRAGPARPQAVGGAGRARHRGPRAHPRRRGVARGGGRRGSLDPPRSRAAGGPRTSASSSPGSSG